MVVPRRRRILACAAVLVAALAGCDRGDAVPAEAVPQAEDELIVLPAPREIAIPPLLAQDGSPFGHDTLRGRWSFVFFGYASCPDICPLTMATLRDAEQELADARFQGVFVSVDPERDTREAIRAYLEAFSPRFVGVTGEEDELRRLGLELAAGFMRTPAPDGVPADRYLVDHSGHVAIVDPEARFTAILKDPRRSEHVVEAFRALAGPA